MTYRGVRRTREDGRIWTSIALQPAGMLDNTIHVTCSEKPYHYKTLVFMFSCRKLHVSVLSRPLVTSLNQLDAAVAERRHRIGREAYPPYAGDAYLHIDTNQQTNDDPRIPQARPLLQV